MANSITIVIPARNEQHALARLLPELRSLYPDYQILLVDDASTDDTRAIGLENGATVITHPYQKGNGAAVKTGARAAKTEFIVFMDGDYQHPASGVAKLIERLEDGFDMVVGARGWGDQANVARGLGNALYQRLASWMVGQTIPDLTSGFRAVRASYFRQFLNLLPNGFSYPTTITMAFFRAGYSVGFEPIQTEAREGKSHLRIFRDGLRFLLIIFRVGTLYSPLRLFVPISMAFFAGGLAYYIYTFVNFHRFTNMSALLFITSVLVFLIGLVSEQITNLVYRDLD
ncbi:MAG: glycosyltransferase family 2 protein [Gammaproteobacteria bacterium]|nr:glycosyltransferase family 2 protein [Gammaproteobacteria bacterium]